MKTKTGSTMNMRLKEKIVDILCTPEHEGKTQKALAQLVGISARTLQNYLTPEVMNEVRKGRLLVMGQSLQLIDRAVYRKALDGDMTAARIIYNRWDQLRDSEKPAEQHPLTEKEEQELQRLEKQVQELENGQNNQP
ncbi:MAG: hypothetical protein VXY83_00105 [Pseudomonadota bacterium]|nr:hypothetical protein [Pseudomonadota bacterium]